MALNGLFCDDMPLRNYSLSVFLSLLLLRGEGEEKGDEGKGMGEEGKGGGERPVANSWLRHWGRRLSGAGRLLLCCRV